jgi:hypothetical protein
MVAAGQFGGSFEREKTEIQETGHKKGEDSPSAVCKTIKQKRGRQEGRNEVGEGAGATGIEPETAIPRPQRDQHPQTALLIASLFICQ